MPSLTHEALRLLFENRPVLASELLRAALRIALPFCERVTLSDSSLADLSLADHRPDLLLLAEQREEVRYSTVVELQLRRDNRKRLAWPLYHAILRARHRRPCCLVVVTLSRAVARWAARPIPLDQPDSFFTPIVLGPDAIPIITDPEVARLSSIYCLRLRQSTEGAHGQGNWPGWRATAPRRWAGRRRAPCGRGAPGLGLCAAPLGSLHAASGDAKTAL
jgi:hypothetical protein